MRLLNIDQPLMHDIAQKFGTPVYIIDELGLMNRFESFKSSILNVYDFSMIALSYKTNPIFGLLSRLHSKGAIAEVCSGDEMKIAEKLGLYGKDIIFNGPFKSDDQIKHAFQTGVRINCDHADEVIRAENIARQTGKKQKIGIRIAFPDIITKNRFGANRFGFDFSDKMPESESLKIIETIYESNWLQLAGLHLHTATNVKDLSHFYTISKLASKLLQIIQNKYNIELDWIDVGGGLGGIVDSDDCQESLIHQLPSLEQYADAVISPLLPWLKKSSKKIELIFEPGRTLYEAYGGLLMRTIGSRPVKDEIGLDGMIVDAGLGMLPLASEFVYPVATGIESEGTKKRYRLYGSSCRQRDILRREVYLPHLDLGSPLLMIGTGAYAMAEAIGNFIHFRPGVVLWDSNNNFTWLRKPETLEHISMLEVWK
jgi:diaminopimelate decarboxylase